MDFRISAKIPDYPFRIGPSQRGLVLGSCFAAHVGGWLRDGKMPVSVNPFGVQYNPTSIVRTLDRLVSGQPFGEDELFEHDGLWHSPLHHGDFSGPDKKTVLERIERARIDGAGALEKADYLLLTFGTAWVYERQGRVVANCHKLPASTFTRRRMTVAETVELLAERIASRPALRVILTVSPVIHRGDGLTENQLSKSSLIVAAHELTDRFPEQVHYFPAYEIVTGELRDYRFYADDMCHPSPQAVAYVRERFAETLLSPDAAELIAAAGELKKRWPIGRCIPIRRNMPVLGPECGKKRNRCNNGTKTPISGKNCGFLAKFARLAASSANRPRASGRRPSPPGGRRNTLQAFRIPLPQAVAEKQQIHFNE